MDEFGLDRPELQGNFLTLEFGLGGRIQQLWCADLSRPSDGEEFQFVSPPIGFGEEFAEDYFPGTILVGARTGPDEPWILSRNGEVEVLDDGDGVTFEYNFGLLDEIRAVGRFYERQNSTSTVVWELTLTNRGRKTIEIGELAFPLALNTVYDGFPQGEGGSGDLFADRVTVHKAINGSASYVFAQRLNGRSPGLLIFPGGDTQWEFYASVPASLQTTYRWEGIPVVYVHSQAVVEREGWGPWFSGHTSTTLEPGESRVFETCFAPAHRDGTDEVNSVLIANKRPAVRLIPGAVVPKDVGIGVEIAGATPTMFNTDVEAELDTDSDDEGGFCMVQPSKAGPVRLSFEDTEGRQGETHLLFIEPIETLIQKRADWIVRHQHISDPASPWYGAILPADNRTGKPITDIQTYHSPFGIESSLADAFFLAEKNVVFPKREEIEVLERYITRFIARRIQSPADLSIGAILSDDRSVASHFGRASLYPILTFVYHALAKIAAGYGKTEISAKQYLTMAAGTLQAMFVHGHPTAMAGVGLPLMSCESDLLQDLHHFGLEHELQILVRNLAARDQEILRHRYPFAPRDGWNAIGFEECFLAAERQADGAIQERILRYAMVGKSLTPSWWNLGADRRWVQFPIDHPAVEDHGELAIAPTSVSTSLLFFRLLNRDYNELPEIRLRQAFGGLLSIWALVRDDGAASLGFCPDSASRQFGMSSVTGDIGIGLGLYLRSVAAFCLPSRFEGGGVFGASFETESDGTHVIRPWDGVGRQIIVRQYGIEITAYYCRILELRFDGSKRWVKITIQNPSDDKMPAELAIRGLWGRRVRIGPPESTNVVHVANGEVRAALSLPAGTVLVLDAVVVEQ